MKFLDRYFPLVLLFYHLIFGYVSYEVLLMKNGDAFNYWFVSKDLSIVSWKDFIHNGTDSVKLLTFPLVKFFKLPFWSGFVIFNAISAYGVLVLYQMLKSVAKEDSRLQFVAMLLVLMPNLHFWTSIPGKECFIFVILILLIKRILIRSIFTMSFFILYIALVFIRPHVGGVFLVALLPFFSIRKLPVKTKIMYCTIFIALLGLTAVALNSILVGHYSLPENIARYYRAHIMFFKHTTSYVPLDQYTLPWKFFTYYFRPLPFEKSGWMYAVLATEHIILLFLSLVAAVKGFQNFRIHMQDERVLTLVLFLLLLFLMYGYAYANYGIIMRTKIMTFPFQALLIMLLMGNSKKITGV